MLSFSCEPLYMGRKIQPIVSSHPRLDQNFTLLSIVKLTRSLILENFEISFWMAVLSSWRDSWYLFAHHSKLYMCETALRKTVFKTYDTPDECGSIANISISYIHRVKPFNLSSIAGFPASSLLSCQNIFQPCLFFNVASLFICRAISFNIKPFLPELHVFPLFLAKWLNSVATILQMIVLHGCVLEAFVIHRDLFPI